MCNIPKKKSPKRMLIIVFVSRWNVRVLLFQCSTHYRYTAAALLFSIVMAVGDSQDRDAMYSGGVFQIYFIKFWDE